MSKFLKFCPVLLLSLLLLIKPSLAADAKPAGYYGYGKLATPTQIAGWDIDVRPDGLGLPPGRGSVEEGEALYDEKCAQCHGTFGESVGRYPALAGGEDTLTEVRPHKTVGSYWRYTSTLWDYIHRSMPFTQPESLADNEVYAVTAYVLHLNDLVDYDFVLSQDNLSSVHLPNENNFIPEQRPDVNNSRCMQHCKDPASITITSEAAPIDTQDSASAKVREALEPDAVTPGSTVYRQHCALCHDDGIGGSPIIGDKANWYRRISKGLAVLYQHAVEGFEGGEGIMPAKGGFAQLSDEDVHLAVDHIVEQSQ